MYTSILGLAILSAVQPALSVPSAMQVVIVSPTCGGSYLLPLAGQRWDHLYWQGSGVSASGQPLTLTVDVWQREVPPYGLYAATRAWQAGRELQAPRLSARADQASYSATFAGLWVSTDGGSTVTLTGVP